MFALILPLFRASGAVLGDFLLLNGFKMRDMAVIAWMPPEKLGKAVRTQQRHKDKAFQTLVRFLCFFFLKENRRFFYRISGSYKL